MRRRWASWSAAPRASNAPTCTEKSDGAPPRAGGAAAGAGVAADGRTGVGAGVGARAGAGVGGAGMGGATAPAATRVDSARGRGGKSMSEKLASELLDASNNTGATIRKRDETHRMAEANKAFSHYRW